MSKVITFSRVFPKYHSKAGQQTYFVEQFYNALFGRNNLMDYPSGIEIDASVTGQKKHTIRGGKRWKVGDKFSPRVWSGRPYNSKQITLCDDVEVVKVFDIQIDGHKIIVDGKLFYHQHVFRSEWHFNMIELAANDGLSTCDLLMWFQLPCKFDGQIICWADSVKY